MTILSTVLWNLLAPALVSSMMVALGRRLVQAGWKARWGVAAGLGLGYFVGHWGIFGWPELPNPHAVPLVAWLALVAAALGMIEAARTSIPLWITWVVRGLYIAGFLAWLLHSKTWSAGEAAAWIGGLWVALLASWWNLESQAERIPGPGWMFHLVLISAGWAAVQVISGSIPFGQLDGVLASAVLGALPLVGLRPGPTLSKGGPAVAITVLGGLGLTGYFTAELPAASAILLSLAPWAPWVDRIELVRRRSPWTRAAIRGLAVLLTVGAGVLAAEASSSRALEEATSP